MTYRPPDQTRPFVDTLRAIEQAWAELQEASDAEAVARAAERGCASAQVIALAADKLTALGLPDRARELLERGVRLDAPPAPVQLALARNLQAAGDLEGARRWLMGAMLRARPDAALGYELAAMEVERGDGEAAAAVVAAAAGLYIQNIDRTVAAGRRLRDLGRPDLAIATFRHVYERGGRDWGFLVDYGALAAACPSPSPVETDPFFTMLTAHARLALGLDIEALLAEPRLREASDRWLEREELGDFLADRIRARRPFSWVRVGDGVARFFAYMEPAMRGGLTEAEADTIGRWLWSVWFGADICSVDRAKLVELTSRIKQAITGADLLGVPSSARLAHDQSQAAFCALLERHLQMMTADGDRHFTDSLFNYSLNEIDPFYRKLLGGLDFLGLVGPHRELGALLGERLGIADVRSWIIPGEGRLQDMVADAEFGAHFPTVYDRTLAELSVPRPGAVFLVAGGLLGKIYCDRIKQLGGIAFDIGAVVDAWMGHNTRGIVLNLSMRNRLVG